MESIVSDSQTSLSEHSSWALISSTHSPLSHSDMDGVRRRKDRSDAGSVESKEDMSEAVGFHEMLRRAAYQNFDQLVRGMMNLPPVPSEITRFRSHVKDGKLKPTPESLESLRHWKALGDFLRLKDESIHCLQLQNIRLTTRRLEAMLRTDSGDVEFAPLSRLILCSNSIGLESKCLDAVVRLVLKFRNLNTLSIHCNSLTDDHAKTLAKLVENHASLVSLSLVQNGLGEESVHQLCRSLIRKASASMDAVDNRDSSPAVLHSLNLSANVIGKDGLAQCATLRRRLLNLGYPCVITVTNQHSQSSSSAARH